MMKRSFGWRSTVAAACLLLTITACGSETTDAEWADEWEALLTDIPTLDTMLAADDATADELCAETLGMLRSRSPALQETPDTELEAAAFVFIDFAEGVFFECPLRSSEHTGWEEGYAEMAHLQAAVEGMLAE